MTATTSTTLRRDSLNGHRTSQPADSTKAGALTVILNGVRGGQGTSTVAGVFAVFAAGHADTQLVTTDPAQTAALLGVALPLGNDPAGAVAAADRLAIVDRPHANPTIRIVDGGSAPADESRAGVVALAVLRGPCYLSVRALVAAQRPPDGIILLAEPGRSLTARDVADVTAVPVVATVAVTPGVARTIDAGLLLTRLHRLRELEPLCRLAADLRRYADPTAQPIPADPHHGLNDRASRTLDTTGTELPVAQAQPAANPPCAVRQLRILRARAAWVGSRGVA